MPRTLLLAAAIALSLAEGSTRLSAAACGFPWTVSATPVANEMAAVSVCGIYAGCRPHNRQIAVTGNSIQISYTQAELPDCQCIIPTEQFTDQVLVGPLQAGVYNVTVVLINCRDQITAGTTSFTFTTTPDAPVLGAYGFAVFAVLLAAVAIGLLRA